MVWTIIFTIINIVASFLSIASFIHIYYTKNNEIKNKSFNKKVMPVIIALILLCSLYTLLVPDNFLQKNVEAKIYSSGQSESCILIQQGEFTYTGFNEKSIQFPLPYEDIPEVEIINNNAIEGPPYITKITKNQFVVDRSSCLYGSIETYEWVARGIPLQEAK